MIPRAVVLSALIALSSCGRHSGASPTNDAGAAAPTGPTTSATPATAPSTGPGALAAIDRVVEEAIARGEVPGAVVVVWSGERLIHRRAYGYRRIAPDRAPMTVDTIFDLASLTKPLATALSIHRLASDKRLALSDPARRYLPELGEDKAAITIEHLLLHTSGLAPSGSLAMFRDGEAALLQQIGAMKLGSAPGTAYRYSDLGFVLLGLIVGRVGGERLDRFAAHQIFAPLRLTDTGFTPSSTLIGRIAPTCRDGLMLEGVVHDPRAALLSGISGHAGLFSTADDVATIGRMVLNGGALEGVTVLPAPVVSTMIRPVRLPNAQRTLGWDTHTGLSSGVGYGHTGFTGTSLFVDPTSRTVVVLLTSRLHPIEKGDVARLRRELDGAVRAAVTSEAVVLNGVDVLEREGFARLAGKKVALVTNRGALARDGRRTIDVLRRAHVEITTLLSPEHGLDAVAEGVVGSSLDASTGFPIRSLYGEGRKKPSAADLSGADTIVFDLQDAGARFYTYETTLGLVLESAREHGLRVVVLDRPNPVGDAVEGPLLDPGRTSFTAYHRTPIRHGMTVGELARLFNAERGIGAPLEVVPMRGYRRDMLFADTALPWVAPSPNLRTATAALLYPGVALVEGTNVSVGRGTTTPFEVVGAPFIEGEVLAKHLNERGLEGVTFGATRFTPTASAHAGVACGGVTITVTDPKRLSPVRLGVALALSLRALHPGTWQSKNLLAIVGNEATTRAIERGDALSTIVASWKPDEAAFAATRAPYLLY